MSDFETIKTFNGTRELWPSIMFREVPVTEPPPEGTVCIHCEEDFSAGGTDFPVYADSRFGDGAPGVYYGNGAPAHLECFLRAGIGGLNHLKGTCSCCGGDDPPDPPDLSRREAALQAVLYFDMTRPHEGNAL
ncbi:hypothetical protein [Candidatus Solirubrobacter pratensis]|uniref:hypothetical protein n=1 Tax=Candidatus Solirubrobacter pratensis TaxID=1298857 RepID=UPI000414E779|nr:hypothetical protein [Candidatus Solirubrobacter pratensis]